MQVVKQALCVIFLYKSNLKMEKIKSPGKK